MPRKKLESETERLLKKLSKPYTPQELARADASKEARESLRKSYQAELDTLNAIAHKEWLSPEAKEDFEFLKDFVRAAEIHNEEELEKLAGEVNRIAAFKAKRKLYVSSDRIRRGWDPKSFEWDPKEMGKWGQSKEEQRRIVMAIDELKDLLADPNWRPWIGVCHYEKCQKFYVKTKKHARFCSEAHAAYSRMKRYRKKMKEQK
ncbi:hypothetical protein HYR54_03050 [Candidatus Acetothermia bacterium]|nr:hypothetical protein [Candidatus Acetothermia bacterium]